MAFVVPIERIAFLVAAMPTEFSSKVGVSLAMFLMNSRALSMVSKVSEEVSTPLTSLSTFCKKNLLHSMAQALDGTEVL